MVTGAAERRTRATVRKATEGVVLVASGDTALGECLQTDVGRLEIDCVDSIDEVCERAAQVGPAVVILGSDLACNRIEVLCCLAARAPDAKAILLFERADEAELLAALHAGASGYVATGADGPRLAAAVGAVLAGESVISQAMTTTLVRQLATPGIVTVRRDDEDLELSGREWEVLCFLRQGLTTNETAERLFISSATVRSHVSAVMQKVGAVDRDAMMARVFPA